MLWEVSFVVAPKLVLRFLKFWQHSLRERLVKFFGIRNLPHRHHMLDLCLGC